MEAVKEVLLNYSFLGNNALDYSIAIAVFFAFLFLLKLFEFVVLARLRKLAEKTKTDIDDVLLVILNRLGSVFYAIVSLYFALKYLTLSFYLEKGLNFVFLAVIVYEFVRAVERLIKFAMEKYVKSNKSDEGGLDQHSESVIRIVGILVRVVLWTVAILFLLSNLGVNVTSLIASLGIGGIAIALALQNIFSDMFSSFSLFIDKPFQVGDYIVIGEHSGTVRKIGLKTTRLKTPRGEELIISNKELTTARVQNLKKIEERRELFIFGVAYETPEKLLKQIPKIVKDVVKGVKHARFDRCHFSAYGEYSLNFETVYFIDSSDYNVYMDTKQDVNLTLFKKFREEGIEFAYPTQVVHLQNGK